MPTERFKVKGMRGDQITVFRQPKSDNWFARIYQDYKRYQTTLKTADRDEAEHKAEEWYMDLLVSLKNGSQPQVQQPHNSASPATKQFKETSFKTVSDNMMKAYAIDGHALSYVNTLRKLFNKLNGMIGHKDIKTVDQSVWTNVKELLQTANPQISQRTLHQYKNGIMTVRKYAYLTRLIPNLVPFVREFNSAEKDTPRVWFNKEEYRKLILALRANITESKKQRGFMNHTEDAEELRDFCIWVCNTGMRISEARNVRFQDVEFTKETDDNGKEREILVIRNISGKRGDFGISKSYYGAPRAFRRIIARHGLKEKTYQKSDATIFKRYHKDAFRRILEESDLYETKDRKPRRRDLMCLRHTYICFNLLRKQPVWDIARNTRTSVAMIEQHYAKHMNVLSSSINKDYSKVYEDD